MVQSFTSNSKGYSMKYILEFGAIGGAHSDNCIISTMKEAQKIAASLVFVLTQDYSRPAARTIEWKISKTTPRITWKNHSHFVALSALDGVPRGPASAQLWRVNHG